MLFSDRVVTGLLSVIKFPDRVVMTKMVMI